MCQLSWNVDASFSCPGLYRDWFTCLYLIIFPELLKSLTWSFLTKLVLNDSIETYAHFILMIKGIWDNLYLDTLFRNLQHKVYHFMNSYTET